MALNSSKIKVIQTKMVVGRSHRGGDFVSHSLMVAMSIVVGGWIALWVLQPMKLWENPWMSFKKNTSTSYFGVAGSVNLLFSAPIFLVVILGSIFLHVSTNQQIAKLKFKKRTPSLWRYPIFIGGPLGTITGGEFLFFLIFLGLLVWSLLFYIVNGVDEANHLKMMPGTKLWQNRMAIIAGRLGSVGVLCLALLFFPVTRGSVLLQLLNVSFEISVKYHIWIGNLTMVLFTAHGMSYLFLWGIKRKLQERMSSWRKIGYSNVAGEIALLAGLIIWLTSLKPIRQRFFEVFYYTHHLYLVFIVFFALHVGDFTFSLALPGIFLFFLDRYIRLLQSKKSVHVISARKMSSNIVQLVIAKNPSLVYNPTSVILLNLPFISRLEWHPFSVISSSSVESDRLSILIKCQHSWTKQLDNFMACLSSADNAYCLQAAVEGPYGPSSNEFLRYESLILIGGGSGIAPLLSILLETLQQQNIKKQNHVPKAILLIWSVKKTDELSILDLISPSRICPNYSEFMKLEVQAYVTQTEVPDVEMTQLETEKMTQATETRYIGYQTKKANSKETSACMSSVCSITSTNNTLWQAGIVVSALVGYLIFMGLLNHFYIYPLDHNTYEVYPWWARGLLNIVCVTVGIVIFGGLVYVLWDRKITNAVYEYTEETYEMHDRIPEKQEDTILTMCSVHHGQRPDLEVIIQKYAMETGGKNVGVIACGPESMQQSVASACRRHTSVLGIRASSAALDFHSISYNL